MASAPSKLYADYVSLVVVLLDTNPFFWSSSVSFPYRKIAYEDIIAATKGFDIRHCTETGGYRSVYKAQLPCGKVVALKKLHR
ncbi:hypothetical protein PTKIN_Ptkin01aG0028300 [Pterospermum kingtungense]